MNLQWMKIYLSVLETGSLAAAARQQHLTQPAVSMIIASMESELGQKLLNRTPGQRSKVQPTPAGDIFRDFSVKYLSDYEKMLIKMVQGQTFAPFVIGTSPTPGSVLLPILTNSFKMDFPQAAYEIKAHPGRELLHRLKQREFDIAITGIPVQDPDVIAERFFFDPLELICPSNMNLGEFITPKQLQKLPLIIRNQKCYTMHLLADGLSKIGLNLNDLNIVMQVYGNSDVLQAVSYGSGAGFVTHSLLNTMPSYFESVHTVTVKRLKLDRHLSLIRMRDENMSSGAKLFWDYALGGRWAGQHFSYNTKPK